MKRKMLVTSAVWLCVTGLSLAQESSPAATASEVSELRQQVQALTEVVKTLQQQVKDQQTALEQATGGAPLPQNPEPPSLTSASPAPSATPAASAAPSFPTSDESVVASAPGVNANGTAFPTTDASVANAPVESTGIGSSLTQPITIASGGGGKNYMNISFDGLFSFDATKEHDVGRLEVGDHDPQQRGFNARNAEIALDGAVDPYFEGFANIVLKLDNNNETSIELEEAFMQTTNLPFGLQLKGGQFFAAFGRLNPTHPHTWEFADAPLVSGRLLGPDGLRGVGAQISWIVPVPWYSQLYLAMQNGEGATAFSFRNPGDNGRFFGRLTDNRAARGLGDFLYLPRWENSVNLSDTQTVL
ncbi:MAG: hypothetical protein ACXWG7_07470, partial [Chthoniobacterales bacterium]